MTMFEQGQHSTFPVTAGDQVLRLPGLKAGTLYACIVQGIYGLRKTGVVGATTSGAGVALLGTLSDAAQTLEGQLLTDHGIVAPHSYFVAGGSSSLTRFIPTGSVDTESSTPTSLCMRVSPQSFAAIAIDPSIAGVICRVSRDGGVTYGETQEVNTPFPSDLLYAVFNIQVPYESRSYVIFQDRFKDGTVGRPCRPYFLQGCSRPATIPYSAPTIGTLQGSYGCSGGVISLQLSVPVVGDPTATDILVQLVSNSKVMFSAMVANVANTSVTVVLPNVDPSIASYTVNAYSVNLGTRGLPATTTWTSSTATPFVPPAFTPVASILLSEKIERVDGGLVSKIRAVFLSLLTTNQPQGAVYTRLKDATPVGNLLKTDFVKQGVAAGDFTTGVVTAGAAVVYQVVVLAVAPNGVEAAFTTAQIQDVNVFQYANYVPAQQTLPTVVLTTAKDVVSAVITGSYAQPAGTPAPIEIRAYKSETDTSAANLVAKVLYGSSVAGSYPYTLSIPDISAFTAGAGNFDITLRTQLENNGLTATAAKTTVRVAQTLPGVPTWGSPNPAAYVKTVRATINNVAAAAIGVFGSYTPAGGGNGTRGTLTPPANVLKCEVADATADPGTGNAGTNAEILVPSTDIQGVNANIVVSPTNNAGTRNLRAKWVTTYGDTGWSVIKAVTFAADAIIDSSAPVLTACVPRFTCNSDGSITITWTGASFGTSGLGAYVIRRGTTSSVGASIEVGTVTTSTLLSWTDFIDANRIGSSYYYWLDAVSGQSIASGAPVAVKLQSGNTYAVETTVIAVSTDSAPAVPTTLVAKGAQGGFDITWANNAERDLKEYVLEWSALGTFADTVTFTLAGTSYFQTQGATASSAVAAAYQWRLKARDFGANTSAACTTVTANLTNYGSVADSAPNAPSALTLTNNNDGSITLNISAPGSLPGTYYRVLRRYKTAAGWTETDVAAVVENDTVISASSLTYLDVGLKPGRWYNYRVYSQSKLGTQSASYASVVTPVQAVDSVAPTAPTVVPTAQYGLMQIVITPAEANGVVELWVCDGNSWVLGSAKKIADAVVGPVITAVTVTVEELDSANPISKTYAARHIDVWGNASTYSASPVTATALNWLRANMIDTVNLKAGSVSADKLKVGVVQRENLVVNGHFGTTSTWGDTSLGWTLGSGAAFTPTSVTYTPTGSSALNAPLFTLGVNVTSGILAEQYLTVQPGRSYTVVALVRSNASVLPLPSVSMRVMNSAGTLRLSGSNAIAGQTIPEFYAGSLGLVDLASDTIAAGLTLGWRLIAYKWVAPLGTTQVRLQLFVESYTGSGGYAGVSATAIQLYDDDSAGTDFSAGTSDQLLAVVYSGDVSGNYDALQVQGIWGKSVAATAPTDSQVLSYVSAASQYQPKTLAQILGYTPVNKSGDTFSGGVSGTTFTGNHLGSLGGLTLPGAGADGQSLVKSGTAWAWGSGAGGFRQSNVVAGSALVPMQIAPSTYANTAQIATVTITPKVVGSHIRVHGYVGGSWVALGNLFVGVYRDGVSAPYHENTMSQTAGWVNNVPILYEFISSSLTPVVISIRGRHNGAAMTANSNIIAEEFVVS